MDINELEKILEDKPVLKVLEQLELQMNENSKTIGGAKIHKFRGATCGLYSWESVVEFRKLGDIHFKDFSDRFPECAQGVYEMIQELIKKYGCSIPDVYGD